MTLFVQQNNPVAALPVGQIVRFGIVGVTATAVHGLTLFVLVNRGQFSPTVGTAIAFLCAVAVTYAGQALWVFKVRQHSPAKFLRFALSAVFGLLANVAIMKLAVDVAQVHYQIGFAAAVVLVPAMTYLINKYWVFADTPARDGDRNE
ncbi:GtrA family protein [Blastomonas aquatica]|uniref:GtrA family protein n=1 Tax=Blastomonas aquatica TaxID=1510276 RepID=UPI00166ED7FF|nr:GtrA family protein [Blastomonas aquatica]